MAAVLTQSVKSNLTKGKKTNEHKFVECNPQHILTDTCHIGQNDRVDSPEHTPMEQMI